ncbi:hypothetical protein BpHYR1_029818 [Brachionus plicatilis]|uniref:Uncharacterized protein n=1 Tax=Brachionus plicatilis TaxID=10195 RepID=A0A3M7SET8_BRAPC|nr:hypothetical protein BpHYR1_029818 [Brachionus plicatilis]
MVFMSRPSLKNENCQNFLIFFLQTFFPCNFEEFHSNNYLTCYVKFELMNIKINEPALLDLIPKNIKQFLFHLLWNSAKLHAI